MRAGTIDGKARAEKGQILKKSFVGFAIFDFSSFDFSSFNYSGFNYSGYLFPA